MAFGGHLRLYLKPEKRKIISVELQCSFLFLEQNKLTFWMDPAHSED